MAKQTFKTPLNFQDVSEGTLEDKVLVRTSDGDVKEIPSDSFGGGGSQDIQQTLDNGAQAIITDPVKITSPEITLTSVGVDSPNTIVVNDNSTGSGGRIWLRSQSAGVQIDAVGEGIKLNAQSGNIHLSTSSGKAFYKESEIATKADIQNGGGSQTLDQVLGLGDTATNKIIHLIFTDEDSVEYKTVLSGGDIELSYNDSVSYISAGNVVLNNKVTNKGIQLSETGNIYGFKLNEEGAGVNLDFNQYHSGNTNAIYRMPQKVAEVDGETFELATTQDLNLQTILDNSSEVSGRNISMNSSNGASAVISSYGSVSVSDGNGAEVRIEGYGELSITNNGTVMISKSKIRVVEEDLTIRDFMFPTSSAGTHTIATEDKIAVSNPTTTALSAANLNTAHPNSIIGTKVHCMNISSGAIIYEKTASGWVQYSVAIVS